MLCIFHFGYLAPDIGISHPSKGTATRWDAAQQQWGVSKLLRCKKNACDVLRFIFQHVGIFAPDFGIAQPFIIRFSKGLYDMCDKIVSKIFLITIAAMNIAGEYENIPS